MRDRSQINVGERSAHSGAAIVLAIASTALLSYFLDSNSGRRRRAMARDKLASASRKTRELLEAAAADVQHRAQGVVARAGSRFAPQSTDDARLAERVRAQLGRLCSHPRAIVVECSDGTVRLKGDVLEPELSAVVEGVRAVHGVKEAISELTAHSSTENVPNMQGKGHVAREQFEYLQENWSPAPRVFAGAAGLTLLTWGLGRRSVIGIGAALGGVALLARSIVNAPLSQRMGLNDRGPGVLIDKTVRVYAEPEEVYAFWRNLENFPQFMSHVKSVRKLADNLYAWKVGGPAGMPLEWQAEITAEVPSQLIAWRTVEGAPIRSSGVVQFEPDEYGGTRLHIRMNYRPPANALGDTVARIFGFDPRRHIDEDLARFKSYIELGKTRKESEMVVRH